MITLTINGNKHEFSGDPSTPVLWYLRDELNLTGPKFGCGMAQCGACTVHIDGVAQRSCVLPDEIVSNMSGNICRCGTYPRIHKAIKSAAKTIAGVQYFDPNEQGEEV